MQIGWRYILDITWILKEIDNLNLSRGSLVMDAGAGNGVLQFILAGQGYNVVSVDFFQETSPHFACSSLFKVEQVVDSSKEFDSDYCDHLKFLK
jgi:2-polyprenyl-3-methyl-5-hydroxy-6-metoxy-1,4-benzoquinol methylase